MRTRRFILGLGAAAALAIPYAASAQQYGQPYGQGQQYPQGQPYPEGQQRPQGEYPQGQPYYGQRQGDYDSNRGQAWGRRFPGYPEFRGEEQHIRREIWESQREDMIEPDDARDLMQQLRQIQWHEQREFQVHGWNLPDDDRQRIRFELDQLDHQVDQIRQEP